MVAYQWHARAVAAAILTGSSVPLRAILQSRPIDDPDRTTLVSRHVMGTDAPSPSLFVIIHTIVVIRSSIQANSTRVKGDDDTKE